MFKNPLAVLRTLDLQTFKLTKRDSFLKCLNMLMYADEN